MKKLLILFMVLAIASSASAVTVEFVILAADNPAGDYQGMPSYPDSTILTIGLVETTQGGIQAISDLVIKGAPTAQVPITYPTAASPGGPADGWTNPALCTPGVFVNDGTTLINGINLACQMNFMDYVIPGTILYTFDYHVGGDPSDIIEIWADGYYIATQDFTVGTIESILIHVPEPVTIALLGLGGLFLRRRK